MQVDTLENACQELSITTDDYRIILLQYEMIIEYFMNNILRFIILRTRRVLFNNVFSFA